MRFLFRTGPCRPLAEADPGLPFRDIVGLPNRTATL
jgi:hypothetical protein